MNKHLSREEIESCYTEKLMTIKEISTKYGVSVGYVFNTMKRFGIETRPRMSELTRKRIGDSNRGKKRPRRKPLSAETRKRMSESHKGVYKVATEFGGHRKLRCDGYITVYCPSHPRASKDGYAMEHVLIMEKHIGRPLKEKECVHHINRIKSDNRIENLQLMTVSEHMSLHAKERWETKRKEKIS